jgi:hypothetical protein
MQDRMGSFFLYFIESGVEAPTMTRPGTPRWAQGQSRRRRASRCGRSRR